ncbi:EAL domain-containing protein [Acidaminococcus fermentans]|nr:EAL domain-containing protein [Acidaminococcus fermentans]
MGKYILQHLEEALENHWVQVYYQPVIRTLTGDLCGLEALARWVDPQSGILSPATFIPVLEEARQIHRLDAYMLEEVCRTIRQRLDANLPIIPVSFNLSRYDFSSLDVFSLVEDTRQKYNIPRDFLHVEITESVLAQNAGEVHQEVDRLRAEGYEVWLDDFGSGFSSLNILKDFQLDLIKLDMGFLRNFTEKSRTIVSSAITMAKRLRLKTLVEGVETREQADFLASIGCGRQQGFYYGKPQPLKDTLALMEQEKRVVEPRKWCHYYDRASGEIHETNSPLALFGMDEKGAIRYLYTNGAYDNAIRHMGYTLQEIQYNLNHPENRDALRTYLFCVERSRTTHRPESYVYIDGGDYVLVRLQVVCEMNGHLLITTTLTNVSQSNAQIRQNKMDANLRYLYSMFDDVNLVDLKKNTIEMLYANNNSSHVSSPRKFQDIRTALKDFARKRIFEEDQATYLAFTDPDTVLARIQKSPTGRISQLFRCRNSTGNYTWRECMAIQLTHGDSSQIKYFWKDRNRRFRGASQAFLDHYGFQSEKEIIGKTDEDMNWHRDNIPYRQDELDVLQKGITVKDVPGECIVKGQLHPITCSKWPLYWNGQIIGLMGYFLDMEKLNRKLRHELPTPYDDVISGLRNRQGFLEDLIHCQEDTEGEARLYCLILLESCFDNYLKKSYEPALLQDLIRKEAQIIQNLAGKDSAISRLYNSTFAIIRREANPEESEALARKIQKRLQAIHQVNGNPVTVTFRWSIVHSTDPLLKKKIGPSQIYRLVLKKLREE